MQEGILKLRSHRTLQHVFQAATSNKKQPLLTKSPLLMKRRAYVRFSDFSVHSSHVATQVFKTTK